MVVFWATYLLSYLKDRAVSGISSHRFQWRPLHVWMFLWRLCYQIHERGSSDFCRHCQPTTSLSIPFEDKDFAPLLLHCVVHCKRKLSSDCVLCQISLAGGKKSLSGGHHWTHDDGSGSGLVISTSLPSTHASTPKTSMSGMGRDHGRTVKLLYDF